ncbi:hypothetical protein TGP89_279540 [Toxoplasma gondii p89]|uniref:Uncharacterized protein n=1 Tax=Toxoplasma gondii p89 TaxID=943119 RepID=A0A086J6Q7_TOXGO|nr:hypothetical protein TGP89_279540 [Toxoplasma gondii p89]
MPLRCSFLQYAASSIVTFDCLLGFSGYRIASRKHSASNGHEYPNEAPLGIYFVDVQETTVKSFSTQEHHDIFIRSICLHAAPGFSVDTLAVQQARVCSATPPQSNDTTGGSHFEIDVNIYGVNVVSCVEVARGQRLRRPPETLKAHRRRYLVDNRSTDADRLFLMLLQSFTACHTSR